jgi:cbb3-type cytochrome oxidase maturation protein
MSVIVLLIAAGGTVAAGFLGAFAWAVTSGQFDDTVTPALRVLERDPEPASIAPEPPASTKSEGASCPQS